MIGIDANDQVYICDPGNSRVQVFGTEGNFLRKWGELGSLPSQFLDGDPQSISVAPNGRVYLESDTYYNKVFTVDGSYVDSVFGYALAVSPDGLYIDGTGGNINDGSFTRIGGLSAGAQAVTFNKRGDIYVAYLSEVIVYEREYSGVENSLLPPGIPQPLVTQVSQRNGEALLDIDYRVTDADSSTVETAALAFLNGGNDLNAVVRMSTFLEGTDANVGSGVEANVVKRLTWDMATDWSVDFAQIQVEVLAKDLSLIHI